MHREAAPACVQVGAGLQPLTSTSFLKLVSPALSATASAGKCSAPAGVPGKPGVNTTSQRSGRLRSRSLKHWYSEGAYLPPAEPDALLEACAPAAGHEEGAGQLLGAEPTRASAQSERSGTPDRGCRFSGWLWGFRCRSSLNCRSDLETQSKREQWVLKCRQIWMAVRRHARADAAVTLS